MVHALCLPRPYRSFRDTTDRDPRGLVARGLIPPISPTRSYRSQYVAMDLLGEGECLPADAKAREAFINHLTDDFVLLTFLGQCRAAIRATVLGFTGLANPWFFRAPPVGNDFLPHLPHLDISRGALTKLLALYAHARASGAFATAGEFLTRGQKIVPEVTDCLDRNGGEMRGESQSSFVPLWMHCALSNIEPACPHA